MIKEVLLSFEIRAISFCIRETDLTVMVGEHVFRSLRIVAGQVRNPAKVYILTRNK